MLPSTGNESNSRHLRHLQATSVSTAFFVSSIRYFLCVVIGFTFETWPPVKITSQICLLVKGKTPIVNLTKQSNLKVHLLTCPPSFPLYHMAIISRWKLLLLDLLIMESINIWSSISTEIRFCSFFFTFYCNFYFDFLLFPRSIINQKLTIFNM